MDKNKIKKNAQKQLKELFSLDMILFIIFLLALKSSVLGTYKVPTGSMIPTIQIRDHFFANKLAYSFKVPFTNYQLITWSAPNNGDIIAFRNPQDQKQMLTKRVVASPGESIEIINRKLIINGEKIKYEFVRIEAEYYAYIPESGKQFILNDSDIKNSSVFSLNDQKELLYKNKPISNNRTYYAVYNEFFNNEPHKVRFLIKRVVSNDKEIFLGLLDDKIEIRRNKLYLNNEELSRDIYKINKMFIANIPDSNFGNELTLDIINDHPKLKLTSKGILYYDNIPVSYTTRSLIRIKTNADDMNYTEIPGSSFEDNMPMTKMKENNYFAMGDNRNNSRDSRFWGQLNKENIEGELLIRWLAFKGHSYFPDFSRFGLLE